MRFGVHLPSNHGWRHVEDLLDVARLSERLGYESVWASQHVFHAGYLADRLGGRPYYAPLPILSAVAAVTTRVRLGTSVLVLPYHHPVLLAKELATLDVLSSGRLTAGVGVGVIREEFDALGAEYDTRGARTDEALRVLKALWTTPRPAFSGRFHRFAGLDFSPAPVQRPHPPIWIGGSGRAAMRRAATLGDGWHLFRRPTQGIREAIRRVRDLAEAAGRDGRALVMSVRCDLEIPGTAASPGGNRDYNTSLGSRFRLRGTPEQIIETVGEWRDSGVEHLVLAVNTDDPGVVNDFIGTFAAEIAPEFG
ncbi:LLM class F420-dependent oxidoreductase [Amycolatopsis mongoliensis]|uniref:LLM class F420-dependent oxidoreductase n=1 Tax=Amycolatopsis mongoliensis TaxID=715475 RepID=A0A9Y2JPE6_9PSEU|nr:LLM class F420-dependent oxidoreductase [Amycolatopsis sp. 4-36]WIY01102.1 LLM class F420-dependent oxidoreductase [Amycolatopsis sp. 4-36]